MMIDREKIEQIVREVVRQLTLPDTNLSEADKPSLLVVGDTSFVEPKLLLKLKAGWNLVNYDADEKAVLDRVDKVLFLHATQDLLVKGALGLFDTPESKLLSRCMMESVPASIIPTVYLQEHLFKTNPKNKAYVSHLEGYRDTLLKFGVKVETFESFIDEGRKRNPTAEGTVRDPKRKKLLTQRDVMDWEADEIELDPNTIITPLARDTARELGKDIKWLNQKGRG